MNIADKLRKVLEIKNNIKAALEEKGIENVGNDFSNYAESIANIKGGGEEPEPEIPSIPEPPVIEENVFTNYNVNLYVPCNYLDNYKYDRVFGSFRYIQCIDSEDGTTNDVVVTPGTN